MSENIILCIYLSFLSCFPFFKLISFVLCFWLHWLLSSTYILSYKFLTCIFILIKLSYFRLERFLEKARSVLDYFGPFLGRIEIMGGNNKIERVYFEIKQSHIDQWEKPQIKVSYKYLIPNISRITPVSVLWARPM